MFRQIPSLLPQFRRAGLSLREFSPVAVSQTGCEAEVQRVYRNTLNGIAGRPSWLSRAPFSPLWAIYNLKCGRGKETAIKIDIRDCLSNDHQDLAPTSGSSLIHRDVTVTRPPSPHASPRQTQTFCLLFGTVSSHVPFLSPHLSFRISFVNHVVPEAILNCP